MAVAHRASAAMNETAVTTTFTITIPASIQADDDLYVTVMSSGHLSGTAYPTVVDDDSGGNTWDRLAESVSSRKFTLWHKKATGSTASKTITVDGCVNSAAGGVSGYSGAGSGDPTTNITGSQNAGGTESVTGFTPDYAGSFICFAVANTGSVEASNEACTDPGALTERFNALTTSGSDSRNQLSSALQAAGPTATGNFTWSQTDATTQTLAWAIKPPTTGTTVTSTLSDALAFGETFDIAGTYEHEYDSEVTEFEDYLTYSVDDYTQASEAGGGGSRYWRERRLRREVRPWTPRP